jgi:hypothetical protein
VDREGLDRLLGDLRRGRRDGADGARDGRDARDDRAVRRARGIFFTPPALAAHVARVVLGPRLAGAAWHGGVPALRVLDPAAGDGRFLEAALDVLASAAAERGAVDREALQRCLVGVERDPALAAAAQARLPAAQISIGEALTDELPHLRGVDVVLGNPPYVRSIRLRRADPGLWTALRGQLEATSHGEWDLYAAFVERALDWVRPGGGVGLVVPSRWLTAVFAARLRAHLAAVGAVRAVVDFGAEQVFPGATTYASVIVLERPAPVAARSAAAVDVARLAGDAWETGAVPAASLGAAPWRFAIGAVARACEGAALRGPALGAVARIVKGAGTNADGVYVIEDARLDGDVVRGRSAGGHVAIEAAATRACLRGRDIAPWRRLDLDAPHTRCIVPYDGDRLIAWSELARRAPRTAEHLLSHRARLEAREDGRFAGAGFHAYGRPQNLRFHADVAPKVVVPDVARAGRAMIDTDGAMVLDTAYALRVRADADAIDPLLLLLVLDSPIVALWLSWAGVPLRGGYVRLKTAYLSPLPLPPPGPALDGALALAHAGDRTAARAALGEAYGIEPALWADA